MDIDKNKRIGLTDEQVKQSREQHGKNRLSIRKKAAAPELDCTGKVGGDGTLAQKIAQKHSVLGLQRIRNRRKELKWSRETLSEKTDVSARFLTCVENGQSGLSLESLGRMSCALGVSTDFLLFGSGTAPIPNDLADALASIPPDYHDLLVKQVRLFSDIIKW